MPGSYDPVTDTSSQNIVSKQIRHNRLSSATVTKVSLATGLLTARKLANRFHVKLVVFLLVIFATHECRAGRASGGLGMRLCSAIW